MDIRNSLFFPPLLSWTGLMTTCYKSLFTVLRIVSMMCWCWLTCSEEKVKSDDFCSPCFNYRDIIYRWSEGVGHLCFLWNRLKASHLPKKIITATDSWQRKIVSTVVYHFSLFCPSICMMLWMSSFFKSCWLSSVSVARTCSCSRVRVQWGCPDEEMKEFTQVAPCWPW